MRVVTLDFETAWDSKEYTLSRMGPLDYIRDSRFHAQMVGVSVNGQPAQVSCDGLHGPDAPRMECVVSFKPDDVLAAHNGAGFDFLILSERFGLKPRHMWDTIFMMRWTGLSSVARNEQHKTLCEILGTGVKQEGTVVSDGKQWPQDFSPAEQQFFAQYCAADVNQCAANMRVMLPYMTDDALQFMSITARMATEPAFVLDANMLEEFIRQLDAEAEEARQKIMEVFHFATLQEFFTAIRSADKFASMLRQLGVEPPTKISSAKTATAKQRILNEIASLSRDGMCQADGLAVLQASLSELDREGVSTYAFAKSDIDFLALREHDDPRVRLLVETRLEMNSSILRSRAETLLKYAKHSKPVPIMLSAFKARTGRYSAGSSEGATDRMQFQNLSKRNPAHLPLRRAIKAPAGYKVVAVDSSQVEARVLAWEANHYELLEHFRQGRDPYAELAVNFDPQFTATQIHDGAKSGDKHCKQLRNVAKTLILACGYGTSAQKFSDTLLRQGMKLADDRARHQEIAANYHAIYRASNAAIVSFWRIAQSVIESLVVGGTGKFGGPNGNLFEYGILPIVGRADLAVPSIRLPNGYCLRYPSLRAQEGEKRIEFVYDSKLGKNIVPKRLYGSQLVENLTQSLAFAILVWQACRMDSDGIALKGNNHDCWYTVVPEDKAELTYQKMMWHMRRVPDWAQGCPIDCDGEIGDSFEIC